MKQEAPTFFSKKKNNIYILSKCKRGTHSLQQQPSRRSHLKSTCRIREPSGARRPVKPSSSGSRTLDPQNSRRAAGSTLKSQRGHLSHYSCRPCNSKMNPHYHQDLVINSHICSPVFVHKDQSLETSWLTNTCWVAGRWISRQHRRFTGSLHRVDSPGRFREQDFFVWSFFFSSSNSRNNSIGHLWVANNTQQSHTSKDRPGLVLVQ